MILRQQPDHPELFYIVDKNKHMQLSSLGVFPMYMWRGKYYYKKSTELDSYMKGGEGN